MQRSTVKTDVVTREDAERRGATNVAEALQSQPGVNPGAYGDLGGISAIQIQGLDRDRVLVLEDSRTAVTADPDKAALCFSTEKISTLSR